jgi:hypothetical protein
MKKLVSFFGIMFFIGSTITFAQSNTMKVLSGDDERSQRIWFDTSTGLICYSLANIETNPFRSSGAPYTRVVNNNDYKVTVCYVAEYVFGRDYSLNGVTTLEAKETKELRGALVLKYSIQLMGVSAQTDMSNLKGNDINSQRSWYDTKSGLQCYSIFGINMTYARSSAVPHTRIKNTNSYKVTVPYFGNEILGHRDGVLGTITIDPGETKEVQGFYSLRVSVQY